MRFKHKWEDAPLSICLFISCTILGIMCCFMVQDGLVMGIVLIVVGIISLISGIVMRKNKDYDKQEESPNLKPISTFPKYNSIDELIKSPYGYGNYIYPTTLFLKAYGVDATDEMLIDICPKIKSMMQYNDYASLFEPYIPENIIDDKEYIINCVYDYYLDIFNNQPITRNVRKFFENYIDSAFLTDDLFDELYEMQIRNNKYHSVLSNRFNIQIASVSIFLYLIENYNCFNLLYTLSNEEIDLCSKIISSYTKNEFGSEI